MSHCAWLPSCRRRRRPSATRILAGDHPWVVPLLYKVLPDSDSARAAAQLAVSIGCWLALAAVVAWCVRQKAFRLVAFCLVLLMSLSVWIRQWDSLLLSESVTISLTVLLMAAWLALVRTRNRWTFGAVVLTTLLWTFAKDTNAYVGLLVVPFVLVWAAGWRPRREPVLLAVAVLAIFVANAWAMAGPKTPSERWAWPVRNVIGNRVLTDAGELRYFSHYGMPTPRYLLALADRRLGRELHPNQVPLGTDPRYDAFRRWVRDHGRQTLARYLATHPYRAVQPVVRDRHLIVDANVVASYRPPGTKVLLPAPLAAIAYPPSVIALIVWFAVLVAAAAWLAWRRAARAIWLVPAAALLLQFPHALIVWNGDSTEVPRHALLVSVTTRLGLLLLSILVVDALLERRRARPQAA
jgi:hypothetical protein